MLETQLRHVRARPRLGPFLTFENQDLIIIARLSLDTRDAWSWTQGRETPRAYRVHGHI